MVAANGNYVYRFKRGAHMQLLDRDSRQAKADLLGASIDHVKAQRCINLLIPAAGTRPASGGVQTARQMLGMDVPIQLVRCAKCHDRQHHGAQHDVLWFGSCI